MPQLIIRPKKVVTVKISSNSPKELIDKYAARIGKLKNDIIFAIKSERP